MNDTLLLLLAGCGAEPLGKPWTLRRGLRTWAGVAELAHAGQAAIDEWAPPHPFRVIRGGG